VGRKEAARGTEQAEPKGGPEASDAAVAKAAALVKAAVLVAVGARVAVRDAPASSLLARPNPERAGTSA
jgi:hypothetical protein